MGFFSSLFNGISSAFSGIASGIGKIASGIVSGISSLGRMAAGAIGGFFKGIASAATGLFGKLGAIITGPVLGTLLGPILGPILMELAIKLVVKIISSLAEEEGVVEPGEKPEEIGYRLQEADQHQEWKSREEFSSFKEYYAYLKEQIPEVDEAAINKHKMVYQVLGTEAEIKAIGEKYDMILGNDVIIMAMRAKMQTSELRAFIDAFRKQGFETMEVEDYFKGKLKGTEANQLRDALLDALHLYYPQKTMGELMNRLGEIRMSVVDDVKFAHNYDKDLLQNYGKTIDADRATGTLDEKTETYIEGAEKRVNGAES